MIKLRWGKDVMHPGYPTLTSYKAIGKVFDISGTQARKLILARFEIVERKKLPFLSSSDSIGETMKDRTMASASSRSIRSIGLPVARPCGTRRVYHFRTAALITFANFQTAI